MRRMQVQQGEPAPRLRAACAAPVLTPPVQVKCDRRAKVEKKLAELAAAGAPSTLSAAEDRDVSCSVCTSHGLRCTFTQAEPKKRRGRRIVEIQAQQKRQGSLPAAADGAAAPEADANGLQGRARHISSYPSPSSTPSTALGLFSVPGLTRVSALRRAASAPS